MSKITSFVRLLVGVYRLVACTCCCAKLLSSVLGAFSLFAWFPRSSWFLALLACLLVFFCLYFVFCFLLLPWFSPILLRYKLANAPIEIQMQKCTVFLLLHTYTRTHTHTLVMASSYKSSRSSSNFCCCFIIIAIFCFVWVRCACVREFFVHVFRWNFVSRSRSLLKKSCGNYLMLANMQ